MRKWKIWLKGVNANGEDEPLPYIDYVEYLLHDTFEQPLRKVTEYPFTLQEKGWGEFDMKIMLYFTDKSTAPHVVDHDLNFQLNHYEVPHTLTFKADPKSSFLKLLNQSAEAIPSRETNAPKNGGGMDSKSNKRRRDDSHKSRTKRMKSDKSSDEDSAAAGSGDDWNDEIDIHALAGKFQQLQADDLLDLVQLVKANQTSEMYIMEDGEAGEFHIDLRTLGSDLLHQLWQFCAKRLDG